MLNLKLRILTLSLLATSLASAQPSLRGPALPAAGAMNVAPAALVQPAALASFSALGFPAGLSKAEFQGLLQRFVSEHYLKHFRRLGEEEDFDHGHFLFSASAPQRPVAILYHTQELTSDPSMDPAARNWLQWVDKGGAVENAAAYERREYPHTATWDWFLQRELGALRQRHTILDKMLDPTLLGVDVSESHQWVFTRVDCGGAAPAADSNIIRVSLPAGAAVCLALSQS